MPLPGLSLVGLAVLWVEGEQRPGSVQHGLRIPWVAWGEEVPLFGVHLGEEEQHL